MSKLFLAAGVAALAITAPAAAAPGDRDAKQNRAERTKVERPDRQSARGVQRERPQRVERQANRQAQRVERPQRVERQEFRQAQRVERPQRIERQAIRQAQRVERPQRIERQQQHIETRQARIDNRDLRQVNRVQRVDSRIAERDQRSANRVANTGFTNDWSKAKGRGLIDGCPPGLAAKGNGCLPPGQAAKLGATPLVTARTASMLRAAQVNDLNRRLGYNFAAPATAASLLGLPLNRANSILPLAAVPSSISYLYPSNSMYDYRYGDGYIYQVDRSSNLIAALIPLLAGGYMPGQYLPANYMNSYVPNNYGYNSFYPNYNDQCTRYANGVVYYVDCYSGMIENVMPLYDSGYGVGQMLPSSYGYYNVPDQYRPYYYDTGNTGYWYAPGAIYQYDRQSSLITSVAALLSPGLTIGQPLPVGYGAYNVPLGFRETYYDSPNNWYRYSNGSIYQVDPVTQLVTAVVASALT